MEITRIARSASLRLASTALFTAWLLASAANAVETLPTEVVDALESNTRALDPITLEVVLKRTSNVSEDILFPIVKGAKWVQGDRTFLEPWHTRYAYQDGRVHIHHTFSVPKLDFAKKVDASGMSLEELNQVPMKCTGTERFNIDVAFDGAKLYEGNYQENGNAPPYLVIVDPNNSEGQTVKRRGDEVMCPAEFWQYAGVRTPATMRDYRRPKLRPLALDLLAQGGRLSGVESGSDERGRYFRFNVTTEAAIYLFDLDPAHNYAVRRLEQQTLAGKRRYAARLSDFRRLPSKEENWLAHLCEVEHHQWLDRPATPMNEALFVETYTMTKCESQPIPADEFVVFYMTPGAEIADATLPEAEKFDGEVRYTVPADPEDLDAAIQDALGNLDRPGRRRLIYGVLLVHLVLLVAAVAYLRSRRRRVTQ